MNKEELLELRRRIVDQTKRLALESDTDPTEKLQVLMGLVRSGDVSADVMNKTYETAEQLPEDASKMDAFLDLLYEIDARLAEDDEPVEPGSEEAGSVSDHVAENDESNQPVNE